MAHATLGSRKLFASWITAALVLGAMWWAFLSWEGRERAYAESDLAVGRQILDGARLLDDSAQRAALIGAASLQDAAARRIMALQSRHTVLNDVLVIATLFVGIFLIAITWIWARRSASG